MAASCPTSDKVSIAVFRPTGPTTFPTGPALFPASSTAVMALSYQLPMSFYFKLVFVTASVAKEKTFPMPSLSNDAFIAAAPEAKTWAVSWLLPSARISR